MMRLGPRFADREEAGRLLAVPVAALSPALPVVFALPRGGVPIAAAIAQALKAPLDLVIVRKLGARDEPELAIGAVVDETIGGTLLNPDVVAITGASETYIKTARSRALAEIERRRALYLAGRAPIDPKGRTAIVVDDGLATGATARVALQSLRRRGAARLILAVPVAPPETLAALTGEADDIVCLEKADIPRGIGGFYGDFHQLEDEEVMRLLAPFTTAPPG